MRRIGLVFIAVILTVSGFAQKTADLGIWGGSSTYWGDIKEASPMQTFNMNMGAYFRYNFNARVAIRAMFLSGNFSSDGMVEDVAFSFEKRAQDLSLMVEINYLRYILGDRKTRVTPYIMGGIGMMYYPYSLDSPDNGRLNYLNEINPRHPLVQIGASVDESMVVPVIPFGFGIKFTLGERMGIGAEYQMRKIFNDKFDDLDDPLSFRKANGEMVKYSDFWHNNDWPGYLGIYVTYKIFMESKACPAYDRKYW
jgi:hypothetical protein